MCWITRTGYEAFERMAFYGVASNLVVYLTTQLHEDTVSSVRNVNNWSGSVWITPILGAYIADSYLGRFWTFTVSSLIYVLVSSFTEFGATRYFVSLDQYLCKFWSKKKKKLCKFISVQMFNSSLNLVACGQFFSFVVVSSVGPISVGLWGCAAAGK